MARIWPRPRGAPIVEVDISQLGADSLTRAVQAGDLTPADAAALLRAKANEIGPVSSARISGNAARQKLAEKLARVIEARNRCNSMYERPTIRPEAAIFKTRTIHNARTVTKRLETTSQRAAEMFKAK